MQFGSPDPNQAYASAYGHMNPSVSGNYGHSTQPYPNQHGFGQPQHAFEMSQPSASHYGQQEVRGAPEAKQMGLGTKVSMFINHMTKQMFGKAGSKIFSFSTADLVIYVTGFVLIIMGYNALSNGGAGTIVPLAAAVQLMGFVMVLIKAKSSRSVGGISPQTLHVWLVGILCRLSVNVIIFWSDHADSYLPSDATCDWAYQVLEFGSVLTILALLREIHVVHKQPISESTMSPVLIGACLVLAVVIHPKLNNCWSNLRFAAGQYLEGVAMIPQIYSMAQAGGKVEALTSHYIACSFVAQLLMFSWWWGVQDILTTDEDPSLVPARTLLIFSAASVLFLADFMYQYVRSAIKHAALVLPGVDV